MAKARTTATPPRIKAASAGVERARSPRGPLPAKPVREGHGEPRIGNDPEDENRRDLGEQGTGHGGTPAGEEAPLLQTGQNRQVQRKEEGHGIKDKLPLPREGLGARREGGEELVRKGKHEYGEDHPRPVETPAQEGCARPGQPPVLGKGFRDGSWQDACHREGGNQKDKRAGGEDQGCEEAHPRLSHVLSPPVPGQQLRPRSHQP